MPDVEPALADIAPVSGVNDFPRDDNDTPEELRARAELAAALEALLDADAASGQDNDLEELLQPTQRAQRLDMAAPHHQQIPGPDTDSNAALSAGPGAIQDVVQSEPVDEPPPASPYPSFPAVLHEEPLIPNPIDYHMQSLEAEEPSTPSQNRIKWIPSSPIKKLASQQYLSKARDYLRRLAQAQGMCLADLSCLIMT